EGKLAASNNVPVTVHEHFQPIISKAPNGKWLLDFKQNMAGMIRFSLQAHAGQTLLFRMGELLDADGNLTLQNIQMQKKDGPTPRQEIRYTCKAGLNEYETEFAVFGFRYAEVGTDLDLSDADIEAIAVYSDMEQTGSFESSNELLNRFVDATVWSSKSNHLDIPTDCPTRERHGWTGDAQIFFDTAAYLFDFRTFAKKYLQDIYDWQKKDGRLPQIVPYGGVDFYMWTMNGSVGWSDIGILYPYRLWKRYGDRSVLEKYYDGMCRYAEFMIRRIGRDGSVRKGQSYGEWAEPADVRAYDWKDFVHPHPEVSTAYTAYVLSLMAEISKELEKPEDEERFGTYAEKCRSAYRKMCRLDTDRQAELVRPLYMGLLTEEQEAYAKKRLIEALAHYGWRLGTGFLSTPLILDVLAKIDIEAAYRLLQNEEIPGWLSMPKAGATTIWEAWEGPNTKSGGIASLNHYSKGAVVAWLFDTMCGIRTTGENRFEIIPQPGGDFTFAKASYQSIYGKIESGWEKTDGQYVFTVTVPANCEAKIILPNGQECIEGSGTYRFTTEQSR
ncbi:MAG: family 78 glycoside hydrolase catalytic domain, partial [Lachnospiraceae bacterium]|nr:family 78 glycoside hydrolase catalytic domain [Lachnospiraceae bacterium]